MINCWHMDRHIAGFTFSKSNQSSVLKHTSAHRLAVIPVGIAGVDALNRPRYLFHDESWGAGEGNSGAQLICDVTAAEVSMGHVWLPTVLIVKS